MPPHASTPPAKHWSLVRPFVVTPLSKDMQMGPDGSLYGTMPPWSASPICICLARYGSHRTNETGCAAVGCGCNLGIPMNNSQFDFCIFCIIDYKYYLFPVPQCDTHCLDNTSTPDTINSPTTLHAGRDVATMENPHTLSC